MSRLEKTINEKKSKKKYKTVCRSIFLFIMIIVTILSIFSIDYSANNVLGDDSKNNLIKYLDIF